MSHQMTITSEGETRGDEADDSTGVSQKVFSSNASVMTHPRRKSLRTNAWTIRVRVVPGREKTNSLIAMDESVIPAPSTVKHFAKMLIYRMKRFSWTQSTY